MTKTTKHISTFTVCLAAAIANGYLFNYINEKYFQYSSSENGLASFSPAAKFFLIVMAAPVVETALFNLLPNMALNKLRVRNVFLLVIIPSLLFSAFHFYHSVYFVMALFGGIIMNWYYINSSENKTISFWLTVLLHASYNLYGYLFVN